MVVEDWEEVAVVMAEEACGSRGSILDFDPFLVFSFRVGSRVWGRSAGLGRLSWVW